MYIYTIIYIYIYITRIIIHITIQYNQVTIHQGLMISTRVPSI